MVLEKIWLWMFLYVTQWVEMGKGLFGREFSVLLVQVCSHNTFVKNLPCSV